MASYGDDALDGWTPGWIKALDFTDKESVIRQAGRDIDPTNPESKYGNITKGVLIAGVLVGGAAFAAAVSGHAAGAAAATALAPALLSGAAAAAVKPQSRTDQGTVDNTILPPAPNGYEYDQNGVLKKKANYLVPALAGGAILTAAFALLH